MTKSGGKRLRMYGLLPLLALLRSIRYAQDDRMGRGMGRQLHIKCAVGADGVIVGYDKQATGGANYHTAVV
jgi:hypothetical protein